MLYILNMCECVLCIWYIRNLKHLKPVCRYIITIWICECVVNSQWLFFGRKIGGTEILLSSMDYVLS